ncbi:MAG: hypothetical protein GY854_16425 [Deltaproteobacteria bacterium]|nr:hypothetical protein [Deltaproteobacteria bacterium]
MSSNEDSTGSERRVTEIAARLHDVAQKKNKQLTKIVGSLKKLSKGNILDSPTKAAEAVKAIERCSPTFPGLDLDFGELLDGVASDQARRLQRRRVEFGRMFTEEAGGEGLEVRLMTAEPMEYEMSPFTVVVDLAMNLATIKYARLALEETQARPEQIVEMHKKLMKRFETGWSAEQFFEALYQAYRIELARKKIPKGDRVTLVDLMGQVALAFQPPKFLGNPVAGNYRPYGRVRYAWDLARLRRAGMLGRNGVRLNLGAATGTSTRRKDDVLYVEESVGRGQYYLTLWFV